MNRNHDAVSRFTVLALAVCAALCGCSRTDTRKAKSSSTNASQAANEEVAEIKLSITDATLPNTRSDWSSLDSPTGDGWTSEAIAEQVSSILNKLGAAIAGNRGEHKKVAEVHAVKNFTSSSLIPDSAQYEHDSPPFAVVRWNRETNESTANTASDHGDTTFTSGPSRLAEVLGSLADKWQGTELPRLRYKFKVFRIQNAEGTGFITDQYVSFYGTTEESSIEQNATWRIHWQRSGTGKLKMESLSLQAFEQVTGPRHFFSDVTADALAANEHVRDQLQRGMNHWLLRNHDTRYFSPLGNPGLAIGDVNRDGRDDLFLCQESGLPNRLFIQRADGSAVDEAAKWNVDWLNGCRSANLIDLDNDADERFGHYRSGWCCHCGKHGWAFCRARRPAD